MFRVQYDQETLDAMVLENLVTDEQLAAPADFVFIHPAIK